jgi:hypothetical protein
MMWDMYNEDSLPKVITIHTDKIAKILSITYGGETFIVSWDGY